MTTKQAKQGPTKQERTALVETYTDAGAVIGPETKRDHARSLYLAVTSAAKVGGEGTKNAGRWTRNAVGSGLAVETGPDGLTILSRKVTDAERRDDLPDDYSIGGLVESADGRVSCIIDTRTEAGIVALLRASGAKGATSAAAVAEQEQERAQKQEKAAQSDTLSALAHLIRSAGKMTPEQVRAGLLTFAPMCDPDAVRGLLTSAGDSLPDDYGPVIDEALAALPAVS